MRIFVVSGEESGSKQLKILLSYLSQILSSKFRLHICGIGSKILEDTIELIEDCSKHATIGLLDTIKKIPYFIKLFNKVLNRIKKDRPDLVILVDFPEFNLRLLRYIKKYLKDITVVYFIPPMLWLWGTRRINRIKAADLILTSFKEEELFYKEVGANIFHIGYPLWDLVLPTFSNKKACLRELYGISTRYVISFLPGIREKEFTRHFNLMVEVAKLIRVRLGDDVTLIFATEKKETLPPFIVNFSDFKLGVQGGFETLQAGNIYHLLFLSDVVITKSGLSTQEAALLNTPTIVLYKTDFLTYFIAKFILKLPYVSLINIVAKREVLPEFLQNKIKPIKIVEEIIEILKNVYKSNFIKEELKKVVLKLGEPGATYKAAKCIATILEKKILRKELLKKRDSIPQNIRYQKSKKIKEILEEQEDFKSAKNILGYASYKSEVQTWDIIISILANPKKNLFLPRIEEDKLVCTQLLSLEDLEEGPFGILQPIPSYSTYDIDLVLVPGVGFSRCGVRLGYGRGYFDRLLSRLPSFTKFFGLAYIEQVTEYLPKGENDILMDKIITDEGVILCKSGN